MTAPEPGGERRYLILHGAQNRRPAEHWEHWLAEELRRRREVVLYPQLPDPDQPSLDVWLELIRAELAQLGQGERVVICHSLSVLAWFHLAGRLGPAEHADRVLLVAPPSPDALWAQVAPFSPPAGLTGADVRAISGTTRLVCGDNDPYCPQGAQQYAASLGLPADVLPGAGHISIADGYGPWPSALRWCLDGAVPLTVNGGG